MNDDELERRLGAAFEAKARHDVPDGRLPPPMNGPRHTGHRIGRGSARWLAPLTAAAVVLVMVAVAVALSRGSTGRQSAIGRDTTSATNSHLTTSASGVASSASSSAGGPSTAKPVHISSPIIGDGSRVGVGMPIIIRFSRTIGDARAFAAATKVTVNGVAVSGAWYFENRIDTAKNIVEGHWRMRSFWPAHARIHLDLPVRGLSAGKGLAYSNDLTLDYTTGAANIARVDSRTHLLTLTSDGRRAMTVPVSLGAAATPTHRGTKVVIEKGASVCMTGPGYNECGLKYTQRLTYDGEYLVPAPWNTAHINTGVDSSNGCTNLLPADAKKLYAAMSVGDVVEYPNAKGSQMSAGNGYGDWDVPWSAWVRGGLYRTS